MKIMSFLFAASFVGAASANVPWNEELWLDGGDYWRERLVLEFENPTGNVWTGRTVAVSAAALGLEQAQLRELRFTDARGKHFRLGRKDADFLMPIDVPPHGKAEYALYFGNARAWELADTWSRRPQGRAHPKVRRETLDCRRLGGDAAWPAGWQDAFRVPIVVANYSDEDRGVELAAFHLPEATHALAHPQVRLFFEGQEVLGAPYGRMFIFPVHLAPRTERTYYLYVREGAPYAAPEGRLEGALAGSFMLAEQVVRLPVRLRPDEKSALAQILSSEVNRLKNPSFEASAPMPEGWQASSDAGLAGVKIGVEETGGALGPRCATVNVAADAKTAWRGFEQKVPAKGGRPYFCGMFVRALDMKGEWWMGGKFCGANGKPLATGMIRQPHALRTPTGWTDFSRIGDAPTNATAFAFRPCGRYSGRLSIDATIFAPYVATRVGPREYPVSNGRDVRCPSAYPVSNGRDVRCPSEYSALAVRQTSATEKVFPDEAIDAASGPWRTSLARNEAEDLQLAVQAAKGGDSLEVEVEPPQNAAGRKLAVKTHLVGLVPVDMAGGGGVSEGPAHALRYPRRAAPGGDGWRGIWPDPLVRTNRCVLAANETRAFRFTASTTTADAPGDYVGKIRWKLSGKIIREDDWRVKVWAFDLPPRPTFAAVYDIRFERNYWKAPGEKTFDAARRRVMDLMAEYKVCPDQFDYGTIFTRAADGTIQADFTRHDQGAEEYFGKYAFPSAYFPRNPFYVFGYSRNIKPFLGEEPYEPGEKDMARLRPAYRKAYQTALKMYWDHIRAKGWADKMVLYISDEPTFWAKGIKARIAAICKMIQEVDPSIPIYSSTWHHIPEWNGLVTVWGAGSYGCFPTDKMEEVRRIGSRLWFTTDGQMTLSTPYCAEEQLLPIYATFHGAEQYEYWGITWVTLPPWRFGWHDYVSEGMGIRTTNGGGFVAYPPCPDTDDPRPCASIRLAAARDGVELHTYLQKLQEVAKVGTPFAAEACAVLEEYRNLATIPNAGGCLSTRLMHDDPQVLDRLRARAGAILDGAAVTAH